jgi:hypothetical protein
MVKKKHPKDMTGDELAKHLFHPRVLKHAHGDALIRSWTVIKLFFRVLRALEIRKVPV